jgi:putative glutamine amidotransferase
MTPRRRPRIGLCTALERARWTVWDREAFLLSRAYVDALQRAGAVALMIPPDAWVAAHPDGVLEGLDGLLLAGGADIDPSLYGASRHAKTVNTRPSARSRSTCRCSASAAACSC